jgi:hypothetical protein
VRYARQASEDACAFCRLLAIRPEAQYTSEASALFAGHEIGKLYHDECHCTAVPIDPGDTYEMPDYTKQWEVDYVDARDDPDVESFEDVLNYMRRTQYARDTEQLNDSKKAQSMDVVTKTVEALVKPVDDGLFSDGPGEFEVVLSTEALDRDGERLFIDEWKTPLPARIHFDSDHGMSIEKTVGSGVPRIDGDSIIVRGSYAKTSHAQMVRELVNDGHITSTSVTFRNIRTAKDARPQRELLNGAFVAVPANADAIVLSSKAAKTEDDDGSKPYGDVKYADPGYQDDGKARYPVDTADHCRSAWSYINQPSNAGKYSPAELSKIKGRIRAAAAKFNIEIADDKKAFATTRGDAGGGSGGALVAAFKQLGASGDNPPRHDDMVQAIHDAAAHLGAQCTNRTEADTGEDEGANKAVAPESSNTKRVGSLQESAEESTAATTTAHKAAVVAAADESADDAARARLAARGRSLNFLMSKNIERGHDA